MKQFYLLILTLFAVHIMHGQIINIPDANFRSVLNSYGKCDINGDGIFNERPDTNNDGQIDVSEAQAVVGMKINVLWYDIASLEGIQYFSNLTYLDCSYQELTDVDLSSLTNLETLICTRGTTTSLNLSGLTNLKSLDCSRNSLTQLNISSLSSLESLTCHLNNIISIDASNLSSLKTIKCDDNNLTNLTVSGTNLETLDCGKNSITSLDISNLPNLSSVKANINDLTTINTMGAINLDSLNVAGNKITDIDLNQNVNLTYLLLAYNELSNLDVSNNNILKELIGSGNNISLINLGVNSNLEKLDINANPLPQLDVSGVPNLLDLDISQTQLPTMDLNPLSNLITLKSSYNSSISLDLSQLTSLERLTFWNNDATTIDLTQNPNLKHLSIINSPLSSLDISQNPLLEFLYIENNQLISLNTDNNINLRSIYCSGNQLAGLDLSNNVTLISLYCDSNQLTNLDVSNNTELSTLHCQYNELESIFVKNGSVFFDSDFSFRINNNPNLVYVCADEEEIPWIRDRLDSSGYFDAFVNSYCSFVPGGQYFTIEGNNKLDVNLDGCDMNDTLYPNLKLNITDGTNNGALISNSSGNYSTPVIAGIHTITPELENPDYYTISPTSYTVDFPTDAYPFTQDFCITPNGVHNDLEISILPLEEARPGFDAHYKILYKNKGNTALSGTVDFTYQDNLMDLIATNPVADVQTEGNLSWNYNNLQPFESGEILVTMSLNTPTETPALNGDDILIFGATITPVAGDETTDNNEFNLNQTVVNSYDPNDKTCLEGDNITPEMVGTYVNYLIRFENTGSASAINIVVKDEIDTSKFDISTLFLTDASHEVVTRIKDGNIVEFIFENINLPFDDANNDGYVAFKIKTLDTLVEGDTFENGAEIYFDYNFPIITNDAITTVMSNNLSVEESSLVNFETYPNPFKNTLYIKELEAIKSVTILDITGRLISQNMYLGNNINIEISTKHLTQGTYFVKVKTNTGESIKKAIKR